MKKDKEYKKEYRSESIDANYFLNLNIHKFLRKCNENDWRIINIINHDKFNEIIIIYEVEIK